MMKTYLSADESHLARRRSKIQTYAHFVWGTRGRRTILVGDLERRVHRSIVAEAIRLGCKVLAINGTADHVHLLVWMPSKLCPAALAKQVKGAANHVLNRAILSVAESHLWQDGYACFSVGHAEVDRIRAYVSAQKEHHEANSTWPIWEETDEESPWEDSSPEG